MHRTSCASIPHGFYFHSHDGNFSDTEPDPSSKVLALELGLVSFHLCYRAIPESNDVDDERMAFAAGWVVTSGRKLFLFDRS